MGKSHHTGTAADQHDCRDPAPHYIQQKERMIRWVHGHRDEQQATDRPRGNRMGNEVPDLLANMGNPLLPPATCRHSTRALGAHPDQTVAGEHEAVGSHTPTRHRTNGVAPVATGNAICSAWS